MRKSDIRNFVFCSILGLSMGIGFAAWAADTVILDPAANNDTLIINKNVRGSVVSGTVKDVRGDLIVLDNNGTEVRVDIDDLNLDRGTQDLIEPGMRITVEGKFEDFGSTPEFKASSMVRNTGGTINAPEAVLLDNGSVRKLD